jgi:hypothetical protein
MARVPQVNKGIAVVQLDNGKTLVYSGAIKTPGPLIMVAAFTGKLDDIIEFLARVEADFRGKVTDHVVLRLGHKVVFIDVAWEPAYTPDDMKDFNKFCDEPGTLNWAEIVNPKGAV